MADVELASLRVQLKRMGVKGVEDMHDQQVVHTAVQSMKAMVQAYLQVVDMAEAVSGQQVVPSDEIQLLKAEAHTGFTIEDRR